MSGKNPEVLKAALCILQIKSIFIKEIGKMCSEPHILVQLKGIDSWRMRSVKH